MSADAPILITGGAGFIGANLADRLAGEGHKVIVYDSLARSGVEQNLAWLKERWGDQIVPVQADVRDRAALGECVAEAAAVFHLAAQVAVTTSLVDPVDDFRTNLEGTLNLLEALRLRGERVPVLFASTNKVYGDLGDVELEASPEGWSPSSAALRGAGVDERQPLDFHTPYGVSKGAADQYVLDYARSFDLPSCVLRMSCIYGRLQMGTEDQGWVAHFAIRVLQGETITLFGDGQQVRDILDVEDAVNAYVGAWRRIEAVKGRAFNLGGGPANAVSLRTLIREIETLTGRQARLDVSDWRMGDQRWYVSDPRAIARALDMPAFKPWRRGLADLIAWLDAERAPRRSVKLVETAA
jgi:CDP-paratose 2-epimerase